MHAIDTAIAWLVGLMLSWTPDNVIDSRAETIDSYNKIANDIVVVAYDPDEKPIFAGQKARAMTAALIAKTAMDESSYFEDSVMTGNRRGDHGRSWCAMQINIGKGKTREGWTGRDLIEDRQKCFRAGLHIMKASVGYCSHLTFASRLSGYTTGRCIEGEKHSFARMSVLKKLKLWMAPRDIEVLETHDLYELTAQN